MKIKSVIPQNLKNIYHLLQAIIANTWFGFPSRKIKVIGITGTNGKTTVAQMIAKVLEEAGFPVKSLRSHGTGKTAMISTINFKLGEKEWVNKTKFTTLSSWATQKFIKKAVGAKCDYLVLETSSHSLDQHRVWGVKYNTAVITNITREHLDYHKTMEKYRQAKLKLFKNVEVAIVNLEMKKPEEFILNSKGKIYGYALKNQKSPPEADQPLTEKLKTIIAEDIELETDYSKFKISAQGGLASGWQNSKFQLHLPGRFNIENALAAVCVGLAEGIDLKTSAKALEKIKSIPGRMESVPNNRELNIIIDYAVTPDSLEKLYELIKSIRDNSLSFAPNSRVVAVLGACGERDRGKRPIMGKIVSRFADYIIITNEDPYNENPQRIIDEVFSGITDKNLKSKITKSKQITNPKLQNHKQNHKAESSILPKIENKNCWRILDRREAIKKALRIAKPGDFIIITGKGAEEIMAVGKKRNPWNDKKVVNSLIKSELKTNRNEY